jgi:hypothetical protein
MVMPTPTATAEAYPKPNNWTLGDPSPIFGKGVFITQKGYGWLSPTNRGVPHDGFDGAPVTADSSPNAAAGTVVYAPYGGWATSVKQPDQKNYLDVFIKITDPITKGEIGTIGLVHCRPIDGAKANLEKYNGWTVKAGDPVCTIVKTEEDSRANGVAHLHLEYSIPAGPGVPTPMPNASRPRLDPRFLVAPWLKP